jgi:hypothetical protein
MDSQLRDRAILNWLDGPRRKRFGTTRSLGATDVRIAKCSCSVLIPARRGLSRHSEAINEGVGILRFALNDKDERNLRAKCRLRHFAIFFLTKVQGLTLPKEA